MRFFALLLIFILSACTQKNAGSGSSVSVKIPSLSELNAHGAATKVTSLAIDSGDVKWSRACFMVTVNASDIPNRVGSTCDLASGIFAGGVAASGTAQSLEVKDIPMGAGRRFDVYAYFRRSDSELCKSYSSLNEAPKDRVARLGVRENVSLSAPVETVDIDITLPVKMIVAEDRLPVTCDVAKRRCGQRRSGADGRASR